MKRKATVILWFFSLCSILVLISPLKSMAYPWMFFREGQPSEIVQLDLHSSYFKKGAVNVFSSLYLNYQNPGVELNLGYSYSFLEDRHYFRVSELSLVFPFLFKDWKMSLGFKDVIWSEADRYWNYGLWQPRYFLDVFRPVQMGLPGVYLSREGDTSLLFLFSYFYLPDIIVYPKLKDGKIYSSNPFFINSFSGFEWNIDELKFFDLNRFFKPLAIFQVQHSIEDKFRISFAYAYKPVNQLQFAIYPQGINLSDTTKNKLSINDFDYSVLSHHLSVLELEAVLLKNMSLFMSLFYENPEKAQLKEHWITDDFESHLTFSLLLYLQESWSEHSKTLFTLGWTKTKDSLQSQSLSNTVTEDFEEAFGRYFLWREALGASIEYQNKKLFQGFLLRFRSNYALDNDFYNMSWENYIYITPQIRVYLSGDWFFRFSERELKANSSAIKRYSDLSRFLLGGQYVF